ncbi:hypothetical protein JTB14_017292 [Gonioctena quinquepunctata]|nr:hypothetical protein JTB14_017292 [Gonioctena quinquepunctata]
MLAVASGFEIDVDRFRAHVQETTSSDPIITSKRKHEKNPVEALQFLKVSPPFDSSSEEGEEEEEETERF